MDKIEGQTRANFLLTIGELTVLSHRLAQLDIEARAIVDETARALELPELVAGEKLDPLMERAEKLFVKAREVAK